MERHLFTLDEARECLPRLREILPGLREANDEAEPLRRGLVAIQVTAAGNGHVVDDDIAAKRRELERLNAVIEAVLRELAELGIELKDPMRGLVDFPSGRGGEVVYLCWQLGEDDIQWWHETGSGFAGRQPL